MSEIIVPFDKEAFSEGMAKKVQEYIAFFPEIAAEGQDKIIDEIAVMTGDAIKAIGYDDAIDITMTHMMPYISEDYMDALFPAILKYISVTYLQPAAGTPKTGNEPNPPNEVGANAMAIIDQK